MSKKNWAIAMALALSMLAPSYSSAQEPEAPANPPAENLPAETYAYIKDNGIYVYEEANASSPVLTWLQKNTKMQVIETATDALHQEWHQVALAPSITGWIQASQTAPVLTKEKISYITTDGSNVRSGASTSYKVVDVVDKGTAVTVIGEHKSGTQTWYRVETPASKLGWVHSSLLSSKAVPLNKIKFIGPKSAPLRSGAQTNYKITQNLPNGTQVTVLSEFINLYGERWSNIKLANGKAGWIQGWELYDNLSDLQYIKPIKNTVLLKGIGTMHEPAASIKSGEILLLLRKNGKWLEAETKSGARGWIQEPETVQHTEPLSKATVTVRSADETLLTWKKNKTIPLKYKLLKDRTISLTGSGLSAEAPEEKIKGILTISASPGKIDVTPESGYSLTVRDYKDNFTVKITKTGMKGKRILLDPGHGGHDSGAVGPTRLYEKDVVLAIGNYLKQELEKQGAIVTITRNTDVYLTLDQRATLSNTGEYDAFISIHANAATNRSAKGTQVFYNANTNFNGPKSSIMAKYVVESMAEKLNLSNRGFTPQDFYVIKRNTVPAILVETAFISNSAEEAILRSDDNRKLFSQSIAEGLENYFNDGN